MEPARFAVGVDLGGTKISSAVVGDIGKILGEDVRPTLARRPYKEILVDIVASILTACSDAGCTRDNIATVGIGSPGPLSPWPGGEGRVYSPPNLPTFSGENGEGVTLMANLAFALGKPVALANDADCFLLGEYSRGAAKDARVAVGITLGTDIGISYIINGNLVRGMGMGPEICHNSSVNGTGRICLICGKNGCPGAYLSGKGVVKTAADCWLKIEKAVELYDLLQNGSEHASVVVRNVGKHLGVVLGNVVNIFHPEVIVVGGSIAKLGGPLFKEADFVMRKTAFSHMVEKVKLVPAALGDNAGVLGAAKLALDLIEKGGAK